MSSERKYFIIKISKAVNSNSIKYENFTCFVTYWLNKFLEIPTAVLYCQFETFHQSEINFLIRFLLEYQSSILFDDLEFEIANQSLLLKFITKLMILRKYKRSFKTLVPPKNFFLNEWTFGKREETLQNESIDTKFHYTRLP